MAAMIRCVSIVAALLLVNVAAKTNKDKVRAQIQKKWGHVIWGDHIGHDDYLKGITAVVGDFICEGACGFTTQYLKDLVDKQVQAFTSGAAWKQVGQNFIRKLAKNPGVVRNVLAGNAMVKATVGIASYNHWVENCKFCLPHGFSCNKCGTFSIPKPNTHQPYFGFTIWSKKRSTSSLSPMVATRMCRLLSATCLLVVPGSRSVGTRSRPEKPSLLIQARNLEPQTHFGTTMQRQIVDPTHGQAPTQPGHVKAGPLA